jgi:hypothetical protein
MADSAICVGVTGTLSDLPVVSPEPVTAQVIKTSRFIVSGMIFSSSGQQAVAGVSRDHPVLRSPRLEITFSQNARLCNFFAVGS